MIELKQGDCLEVMKSIKDESIDLIVTSPPYDNLRTYNGNIEQWNFDKFMSVADEIYRIIKKGGIVIWVVGDATIKGSETGTSFRQALYFKQIGFNIHDTMLYKKQNYVPLTHNRYEQEFEYMFVFSKGKPKTFNPIMIPCKYAGTETWGNATFHKSNNSGLINCGKKKINDYKQHGNIFTYMNGKCKETEHHPAPFPEQLAIDNINSWSNENDIVLDCFMGSGTTGVACKKLNRNFIGIEIDEKYFEIAKKRIDNASIKNQISLFD